MELYGEKNLFKKNFEILIIGGLGYVLLSQHVKAQKLFHLTEGLGDAFPSPKNENS